ncbi:MAG: ROK family protein [Micromonosporaceae bacterium]
MTLVAALDIGGTKTAAALVRGGEVLARARGTTPAADGPEAVLDTAATLVRQLGGTPERFAAGVAGFVDPNTGVVRAATSSIAGWDGTEVTAGLASRLGIDGVTCNDVHGFVVGEVAYGAAAGASDAVGVALGTGIGGGVVAGGRLLTGVHGAAGHLGHLVVPQAVGLRCPCGTTGHLEAVASGPAIAAGYARLAGGPAIGLPEVVERARAGGPAVGLPEALAGGTAVGLPEVVERARAGDPVAADVLRVAGEALGAALGSLVNAYDPEVVVIGGGAAVPEVLAAARPALEQAVMPVLSGVPVKAAGLGLDATLIGAAVLAVTG